MLRLRPSPSTPKPRATGARATEQTAKGGAAAPPFFAAVAALRWATWFAVFGAIVAVANLRLGNHITVGFWVASWALPGLLLDLSRLVNGGKAWERKEGWITWRTVVAVVIVVAIASPLESVLDRLGGYHPASQLVNTDWSQLADAVSVSIAFPVARQFLQWTKPKAVRPRVAPGE